MKTLTILDTRGLLLRDFHTSDYSSAKDENGEPIISWEDGLARFYEQTIEPLLTEKIPPQNIIAAWDGGNDYRLNLYPAYKEKRRSKHGDTAVNREIKEAIKQAQRLLAYLGIKSVTVPGEEADDLVALLCERLEADHFIVRTLDGDLKQLISDRVSVWCGNNFCTKDAPCNSYCSVPLIPVFKALCGDSTDGYGGVHNFGPKGFMQLVESYGEDGLLQIQEALETNNFRTIEAVQKQTKDPGLAKLLEYWSDARLCLELGKLHPEACYGASQRKRPKLPQWHARVPNREEVAQILGQLGMSDRMDKLGHIFPTERLVEARDCEFLTAQAQEIISSPVVSWDYESTDKLKHPAFREAKKRSGGKYVDVLSQEVTGISINYGAFMEKTIYVPFDHKDTGNFNKEWLSWILNLLKSRREKGAAEEAASFAGPEEAVRLLEAAKNGFSLSKYPTFAHNAAFETTVSMTNVQELEKWLAPMDTSIMSSYVDENLEPRLKELSLHYLGYRQATYEETTGGRDMCDLTGQEVLSYGCDDSLVTSHLAVLFSHIMQLEGSWDFYRTYEVDPVVNDCLDFIDGQEIDYELLAKLSKNSREALQAANETLRGILEERVNTRDSAEVQNYALTLFNEWYSVEKFKADGDPKKDEEIRTRVWEKAWRMCWYQPFSTTVEIPPFVSTPTMINKVIALLDANAPKLKKASGPGVEGWEGQLREYLENKDMEPSNPYRLEELAGLLFAARKKLGPAGRSGPKYEQLKEWCDSWLQAEQEGKEVKTGDELNTNSDPQMQALLYGKLGLPIRKRSKVDRGSLRDREGLKGSPATGLKAIAAAYVYDLADVENDWRKDTLEQYRTIALEQQNQSLYFNSYPLWRHPKDGRIHPQIRNCGTVTRRPAGNDPNKLQVSKKEGGKIRKVYLPGDYGDGPRVIVCADFANQELVITACESRDPVMLDAFSSEPRKDLHSYTSTGYAHILLPRLGVDWNKGRMDYDTFMAARHGDLGNELKSGCNNIRNKYSKAVNFLIAYLGGHTTLAGNLLISNDLAKELMNSTFSLYARLQPWQQEVIAFARSHGYTQTAYGNRRHATADLYSDDDFLRTRQERQVVNFVIQGGAADILKVVRQEIYRRKMRERYRMKAVGPVYDEIEASVPVDRAADYCEELVEVMSITPPGYPVGMKVDLSIGNSWGNQMELETTDREEIKQVLESCRFPEKGQQAISGEPA